MNLENDFLNIIALIKQSRANAIKSVNAELINLYWNIGSYITLQLTNTKWGEKTVDELAHFISKKHPDLKGFNRRGLYRMKQFYESYANTSMVSVGLTQIQNEENEKVTIVSLPMTQFVESDIRGSILAKISWTNHLTIFGRCKTPEEREFYIRLSLKENYTVKELERQINASYFERTMLNRSVSPQVSRILPHDIDSVFKDNYVFEFLNLTNSYTESELQKSLITNMKYFILELGKDFLFVDQEYRLQVGNRDFKADLLFYHRNLQCLVAFELKTETFEPEHLGKLNFYLEALDRNVKKPHENPSIGVLLCKDKDTEVVEYALNRQLSPAMVSHYTLVLPEKKILQNKLHELYEMWGNRLEEEK